MQPLTNRRILITRAPHQVSALATQLRDRGATVLTIPTISIQPLEDPRELDKAIRNLERYDWLLFTSANAVEVFNDRLLAAGRDLPQTMQTAAIGPATARAAQQLGLTVDLQPPAAVAESFAQALLPHAPGTRMLLVRAQEARDVLPDVLRESGARVDITPAYRTVIPTESVTTLGALLRSRELDCITVTSSSAARNLFTLIQATGQQLPPDTILASIGPITSQTLEELDHPPHIEADEANIESLAEAIDLFYRHHPKPQTQ